MVAYNSGKYRLILIRSYLDVLTITYPFFGDSFPEAFVLASLTTLWWFFSSSLGFAIEAEALPPLLSSFRTNF